MAKTGKMWSPRGPQLWVYFVSAERDEETYERPYGPYRLVQVTYGNLRVWKKDGFAWLARWDGRKELWILDGEGARTADRGSEWSDFVVYSE